MVNEPALGSSSPGRPSAAPDAEPGLTAEQLEARLRDLAGPAMRELRMPLGPQPSHPPGPPAEHLPYAGPAGRGGGAGMDRRPPSPSAAAAAGRFRDVLEAMPDALVIVDADGRIVLVNSQAERLFGYG